MYSNINFFNQQGLEKFNDTCTQTYFKGTNMKVIDALKQLLKKKIRLDIMNADGYERVKKMHLCRNCKAQGHTILTCTICTETCCCRHLKMKDNSWVPSCLLY